MARMTPACTNAHTWLYADWTPHLYDSVDPSAHRCWYGPVEATDDASGHGLGETSWVANGISRSTHLHAGTTP